MTTIKGLNIEIVKTNKYLGVVIDNKLTFQPNALAVCKHFQQRLFFLRKLFYDETVSLFLFALWHGTVI